LKNNILIGNKMKTKIPTFLMSLLIVPVHSEAAVSNSPVGYLIGGIIALFILGYLIYTLMRPEKF
jgi:K+-transporting ATPase KdpF subunit